MASVPEKEVSAIHHISESETLSEFQQKLMEAVFKKAQNVDEIIDAYTKIINTREDNRRLYAGMWIGAGLTSLLLMGSTVLALADASAALVGGSFLYVTACAGGTFALITRNKVNPRDMLPARNSIE